MHLLLVKTQAFQNSENFMNNKKTDIFIFIIGFFGLGVVVFFIFYGTNPDFFGSFLSEEFFYKNRLTGEFPVEKEKMFAIMADVKNYPKIFPERFISVKILNETKDVEA